MRELDKNSKRRIDNCLKILNARNRRTLMRYYHSYLNTLEGPGDKLSFSDWNLLWAQVGFIGERLSQEKSLSEAVLELFIEVVFGKTFEEPADPQLLREYWNYFLENIELLRRLGTCKNCDKWFYHKHLGMRHCGSRCRNAYRTRCYRRKAGKQKALPQASEEG